MLNLMPLKFIESLISSFNPHFVITSVLESHVMICTTCTLLPPSPLKLSSHFFVNQGIIPQSLDPGQCIMYKLNQDYEKV